MRRLAGSSLKSLWSVSWVGACSWLCTLLASSPALAAGALTVDGRFFRDAQGGVVILRGADVAGNAKVPPFEPVAPLSLLDPLPGWGMNVVRLLFTWEAYEPEPGQYDDAGYLAYYTSVVRAAGDRGIHVVVDFHQDAYSRFSLQGCGEGFPEWTLPPTVTPATPDNGPSCVNWGQRQVGDSDLTATWTAFYADTNGARSAYLSMVSRVAAALAAEPAVIGYDLLNEPGGDEISELSPLYEAAAPLIRAADPKAILFVSPGVLTSAGNASRLPKPSFDNFAFSPHFYDPIVVLLRGWQGSDESIGFGEMNGTANAWGVPLFVGEFGAAPDVDQVDGYMGALHAQLDASLASAAQWAYTPGWNASAKDGWDVEDYSIVDDKGALRANFRPRPFARRIAGTPSALSVSDVSERKKNSLQLTWQNDPAAGATELYLPADYFGGAVMVTGSGDVHCSQKGELWQCSAASAGEKRVEATAEKARCGLTGAEALLIVALVRRRRRR